MEKKKQLAALYTLLIIMVLGLFSVIAVHFPFFTIVTILSGMVAVIIWGIYRLIYEHL
jgi:hypothetical protein